MSDRLETTLAELGSHVEFPAEPDVAAAVRARLVAEPARRERRLGVRRSARPALAYALALLVAVAAGLAAVPSARSAILEWLGLKGVKIERVPVDPTPAPTDEPPTAALGRRTSLAVARRAVGFKVVAPSALGSPEAVYLGDEPPGGLVSLVYDDGQAILSQFQGRTHSGFVRKAIGPGTRIDRVTVNGRPGFWIAGRPHSVVYEDKVGLIREDISRLAGNTLLWRRGALTLRLEADISKQRALAIARSVR